MPTFIVVALMHTEATPLARTIAFVFLDSEEVDDHALTLMSVTQMCTIAVITSCALILLARITAHVAQDSDEMDDHALMLMM